MNLVQALPFGHENLSGEQKECITVGKEAISTVSKETHCGTNYDKKDHSRQRFPLSTCYCHRRCADKDPL
jgi:hypothetical protein